MGNNNKNQNKTEANQSKGKGVSGDQHGKGKYSGNRPNSKGAKGHQGNGSNGASAPSQKTSGYDGIKSNDISWWNNSVMYSDAVRVPFNRIHGDPITDLGVHYSGNLLEIEGGNNPEAMPGVMSISFVPTPGTTTGGGNSPVNRAFMNLFSEIFSRQSGIPPIVPSDLAMFMTSAACIPMVIALVKRALGVSQLYAGQNYYYPFRLLEAMGISPTSVIGHQDQIRMRLNDTILSFNNMRIPDIMPIYKRWYSLCHNVFAEEDSITSQLFVFKPRLVYQYVDTPDPDISDVPYLAPVEIPDAYENEEGDWVYADIMNLIDLANTLIASWRNSSDLGLISGNLQRYFAEGSVVSLDYVTSGETLVPVPDRNILWQINNLVTAQLDIDSLYIKQDPVANVLVFEPKYPTAFLEVTADWFGVWRTGTILNSFDGIVDDEFIMESTRLIAIPRDPELEDIFDPAMYMNTEVVSHFTVHWTAWHPESRTMRNYRAAFTSRPLLENFGKVEVADGQGGFSWVYNEDKHRADMRDLLGTLGIFTKFKCAPRIQICGDLAITGESGGKAFYNFRDLMPIGDISKYTILDREMLVQLNKAALQSIYAVSNISTK